ncbi:MAG: hypothetical protein ABWJ42_01070 [Sulfolobales archaeon]
MVKVLDCHVIRGLNYVISQIILIESKSLEMCDRHTFSGSSVVGLLYEWL